MYFGLDAAALEVGERLGQRVHPHAVLVERNADRVDAKPGQPVQRALIGVALDDHGIAAGEQRRVDEVERLQRAGDDQDVVGDAVDAGVALQLAGEEFAQGAITLRAAGKPVGGERLALALSTALTASIRPSTGTWSGSLLPPTKLYLASPVHLAAGAGNPAGSSGAKSKVAEVMDVTPVLIFLLRAEAMGVALRL